MSRVTCHVSCVSFFYKVVKLVDEGSVINRDPRLVNIQMDWNHPDGYHYLNLSLNSLSSTFQDTYFKCTCTYNTKWIQR